MFIVERIVADIHREVMQNELPAAIGMGEGELERHVYAIKDGRIKISWSVCGQKNQKVRSL